MATSIKAESIRIESIKVEEATGVPKPISEDEALLIAAAEKRVVRKLDIWLLPPFTLFYFLSFLDKTNIGNARVAGLQTDLNMTDKQYQICATILYVPYILSELPSNLLLRRVGPNVVLPIILTLWGMVCTLQGAVKSYTGLVVVRAFLGLLEGPLFPGIVLYLSGFYARRELSVRISFFFALASLSGAFSGLLAAAIENMDGMRGLPGWAWIFILEGLFTVLVGLASFFLVPATPEDMKFLDDADREVLARRLYRDRPTTTAKDRFSFKQVWLSATSPHVVLNALAFFANGGMLYGLALFLPTIVNQLGFSTTRTQLISVPPFAVGFVYTITTCYLSDRYKTRASITILNALVGVAGFATYLGATTNSVKYGSLFLSVAGSYSLPPVQAAWMANNSEPHYRRATSIALGFIFANIGGIVSIWRFPKNEGPKYLSGTIMDLTLAAVTVLIAVLMALYLIWCTRQKEKNRAELLKPYVTEEEPDGGQAAWEALGDQHPDFKYVL